MLRTENRKLCFEKGAAAMTPEMPKTQKTPEMQETRKTPGMTEAPKTLGAPGTPELCDTCTDERGRERVRHGTALFPVACYDTHLNRYPVSWHWHTELEAVVVRQGSAVFAVGQERCTVRQGEGILINSGVLHAAWSEDGNGTAQEGGPQNGGLKNGGLQCGALRECGAQRTRLWSAVCHARLVAGSLDSVFWQEYLQPLTADSTRQYVLFNGKEPWHAQALCAVETVWKSCARPAPGYEFEVREALSRLTLLVCRHHAPAQTGIPERALREEERLKQMLRFIEENYAAELTAAQIAQSARISESECLRCFQRTIGTPPSQYVKQLRVQKAAQLLAATGRGVAEIGALCGFQDASYFTKTFRERKGCTPSEFRQRSREGAAR